MAVTCCPPAVVGETPGQRVLTSAGLPPRSLGSWWWGRRVEELLGLFSGLMAGDAGSFRT